MNEGGKTEDCFNEKKEASIDSKGLYCELLHPLEGVSVSTIVRL